MKPDFQRALIPRDDALHLIGALNAMKDKLHDAAQRWELLDENGHVPVAPSYTALLQHATDAQDLSREVLRLADAFARSPHHTTRTGRTVLKRLATAATISSHAAPHFTETAEAALTLHQPHRPALPHESHGHRPRLSASLSAACLGIPPRRSQGTRRPPRRPALPCASDPPGGTAGTTAVPAWRSPPLTAPEP